MVSRPTGDKDIVKKRIRKQKYVHHAKHVLEDIDRSISGILAALSRCLSQAKEVCKPKAFFVKQAKERNRRSCLCQNYVETKIVII